MFFNLFFIFWFVFGIFDLETFFDTNVCSSVVLVVVRCVVLVEVTKVK